MKRFKAQSLSEYTIFLAIALIAIVAMNVYVKRGLQGRYADVTDSAIRAVSAEAGRAVGSQYEPYYVNSQTTVEMPRNIGESIENRIAVTRSLSPDTTVVSGRSIDEGHPD